MKGKDTGRLTIDRLTLDAYKEGRITPLEGKLLQQYSRQSPRGRKRARSTPISPEKIQAMKDKLERVMAQFEAKYPNPRH
ncbi:hypothetical protein GCM10022239_10220 [Leifsonia bigeumensis]|uniref:Uncharacterized protein n=1 Tax=Leifsonella bigeumensis TaxID=433643 RepID=A0ABP7FCB4_9MICO